jgi:GAF domain-containing protein
VADELVERLGALADMADELFAEPAETPTLERVVKLALGAVHGCDAASVSLRRSRGRAETPVATDMVAVRADCAQYELRQGPCLDAMETGEALVVARDLRSEVRWPSWTPQAVGLGLSGVLGVGLRVRKSVVASLNLYARRPAAFDAQDVRVAQLYATHAGIALSTAREVQNLRAALASRHAIGVAQGLLMARYGLRSDRAFEVLRRYSQMQNVKLRELAVDLAAGRRSLGSGGDRR